MDDVQNHPDERNTPIDQVGVSEVRFPITVLDRAQRTQATVATISMSVNLPHEFKGTHMSRFIEALNAHRGELTVRTLPGLLEDLRARLRAESARVDVRFPYFLERSAPETGAKALMDYECRFVGEIAALEENFLLGVSVPVTSLCPCSKAISDYGAHNQRGVIRISVRTVRESDGVRPLIWIEELIDIAERSASSPVYPLLKRADERHVTMRAYENPVFVEDMVRGVALQLREDPRIAWFKVFAENLESIHNHSAFAEIEWQRAATDVVASIDRESEMSSSAGSAIGVEY